MELKKNITNSKEDNNVEGISMMINHIDKVMNNFADKLSDEDRATFLTAIATRAEIALVRLSNK